MCAGSPCAFAPRHPPALQPRSPPGGTTSRLRLRLRSPGSRRDPHSLRHEASEYLHDEHFPEIQLPTAANAASSRRDRSAEDEGSPQGRFYHRQHPYTATRRRNFKKRGNHYNKLQRTAKILQPPKFWGVFIQKRALPSTPQPPPGCGAAPARPGAEGGAWDTVLAAAAAPPVPSVSPQLTSHGSRPPSCSW